MNHVVRLTYKDDKTLNIALPAEEVPKFLEKMKKNEAYWTADADSAFWTPENQIRFVNIVKEQPAPAEPIIKEDPTPEEETPTETIKE